MSNYSAEAELKVKPPMASTTLRNGLSTQLVFTVMRPAFIPTNGADLLRIEAVRSQISRGKILDTVIKRAYGRGRLIVVDPKNIIRIDRELRIRDSDTTELADVVRAMASDHNDKTAA